MVLVTTEVSSYSFLNLKKFFHTYPTFDLVSSLGLNGISGEAINITSGTVQGKSKFGGGYDNALSEDDRTTISQYDWEFELNDEKTELQMINAGIIQDVDYEVKRMF